MPTPFAVNTSLLERAAALEDGSVRAMTTSQALAVVHELACLNAIDALAASGDAGLDAHERWQRGALERLGLVLHEHAAAIDARCALPSPALCPPVADWLSAPERDMDARLPSNAARICLALAADAILDAHECGQEEDLLAARARQQHAIALARVLVALHADRLDGAVALAEEPGPAVGNARGVTMEVALPRAPSPHTGTRS